MVLDLQLTTVLLDFLWTEGMSTVRVSFSYCALFPSSLFSATQNPFSQTVFLLLYYFTIISSRRNKKVYATNSTLKSSKMSMDCWNSQGKDLQRNSPKNKDLSFQLWEPLWAPVNESLSEQEYWPEVTFLHIFFSHAVESSLNSFLLQPGNGNHLKSLYCGQGLLRTPSPLSRGRGAGECSCGRNGFCPTRTGTGFLLRWTCKRQVSPRR